MPEKERLISLLKDAVGEMDLLEQMSAGGTLTPKHSLIP